eukprot:4579901-Amphidinium_carterae.1
MGNDLPGILVRRSSLSLLVLVPFQFESGASFDSVWLVCGGSSPVQQLRKVRARNTPLLRISGNDSASTSRSL